MANEQLDLVRMTALDSNAHATFRTKGTQVGVSNSEESARDSLARVAECLGASEFRSWPQEFSKEA